MMKSKRTMRRAVLAKMLDHLREHYLIEPPPEAILDERPQVHAIDAAVAFRSDPLLDDLRSALERIDNGTFGTCIRCKGQIAQEVLDVDPTQRFCADCEREFHQRSTVEHDRHLVGQPQ